MSNLRPSYLFLVSVFILFANNTRMSAQSGGVHGFIEVQNHAGKGTVSTINFYASGPVKGKIGWSVFSLTNQDWAQAHGGLTYSPRKWVTISGSVGLERDKNPLRLAGSVWISRERWSVLSIHEYGGSGYWNKDVIKFQAARNLNVGLYAQRFVGIGPYIEKSFGRIYISGTYLNGAGKPQGFITLGYSF